MNATDVCECGISVVHFGTAGRPDKPVGFHVDPEGAWRLDADEEIMHRDAEHRYPEPRFRYSRHSCVDFPREAPGA